MAEHTRLTTLAVLGATGSIGANTLDVLGRHRERYRVAALTAHSDVEGMRAQCRTWRPAHAVMADAEAAERLREALRKESPTTEVHAGREALGAVASLPEVDCVMAAIVGAAGLSPTLEAARAGKRVLLANKEALVMAGPLMMEAVADGGGELLPVDSEHNALFQCMPEDYRAGERPLGVRKLLLTASGGPFRRWTRAQMAAATPEQACKHPNWEMGRKISVDSATLMNKGLEVIEAHWIFAMGADEIEVLIHPQSVIHSMVDYEDGSVLAQMGQPDMRIPIAHALAWPRRMGSGAQALDLKAVARLEFEAPDRERFPCLQLCYDALRRGGTASAVLNAANEVAVQGFLDGAIGFMEIADIIETTLAAIDIVDADSIDAVVAADEVARAFAARRLQPVPREARP